MFALVATLCTGLFAGAAGYITLVEQPARLQAGLDAGLEEFRAGFARARAMQASLALGAAVAGLVAWLGGAGVAWLVVAVLMAGVVVFTLTVIRPVYEALVTPSLTASAPETLGLLERWGMLHQARSLAGMIAFLIALVALSFAG